MKEATINIINALRGQQAQLKRLLAQKAWINDAPRPELSEIEFQVIEVKCLLAELEKFHRVRSYPEELPLAIRAARSL
jgi:hypothetical protein